MPFKSEQRFFTLHPFIIILSCLLSLWSFTTWGASDSLFQVKTDKLDLTFSQQGALPTKWKACSPTCIDAVKQKTSRFDTESLSSQQLELLIEGNPELTRKLNSIPYTLKRTEDEQFIHLYFLSEKIENGIHLATGLVFDDRFDIVRSSCTSCHSAKLITQNRMSRDNWEKTIRWMQETQKLWDLGPNEPMILDYLAEHYAPVSFGRRKNLEITEWYVIK